MRASIIVSSRSKRLSAASRPAPTILSTKSLVKTPEPNPNDSISAMACLQYLVNRAFSLNAKTPVLTLSASLGLFLAALLN